MTCTDETWGGLERGQGRGGSRGARVVEARGSRNRTDVACQGRRAGNLGPWRRTIRVPAIDRGFAGMSIKATAVIV